MDQWTAFVKTCLPAGAKISKVTPVGDRKSVIKLCSDDQADDGRLKIYIIDADFDYVVGRRKPSLKYLYRIPFSNLEAVFTQSVLVGHFTSVFLPDTDVSAEIAAFSAHLENDWGRRLRKLWIYYGLNDAVGAGCVTCGYHISRLAQQGVSPWLADARELLRRANEIRIAVNGQPNVRQKAMEIKQRTKSVPIRKIISGKTYLLPLTLNWIRTKTGITMSDGRMMMMLASQSQGPLDKRLANRLAGM